MDDSLLDTQQIQKLLSPLDNWELKKDSLEGQTVYKLQKSLTFSDFKQALDALDLVAEIAEKSKHHPDIFLSYNKLTLTLWTHSLQGLTEKDFSLAAKIDQALKD